MLDNHDTLSELRRQLEMVRRRVSETVARLAEAEPGLTANGLEGVSTATWAQGKGNLFQLCVRLEVALAESGEAAANLTRRLKDLGGGPNGGSAGRPWVAEQSPTGGEPFAWQN